MSFAFMPLYTGDYLRDTRHLTPMRHGVYLLLLMHCWDQKGPLPLDEQECAGIANCRSADEVEALRYIVGRFFIKMEDGNYSRRMQAEIERSSSISAARSQAGRKGFEARARQLPSKSKAIAKQVHLPPPPPPHPHLPPEPEHKTPSARKRAGAGTSTEFESQFWPAYPKHQAKADARKAFDALNPSPELLSTMLAAIAAQRQSTGWLKDGGAFVPLPATWLRGKRWEDEAPAQRDAFAGAV